MAAGLGFKDFTTGEVLTAADVDGYLMQGIWVFASTAARDAAVTAPAEGNFAFTKDTNSLWYYDGAAWVASGATGDIEGITAGIGISGGGTSGTVTVTNSMATAIDAKGDLVVGTGADTFSKLTVGANGTTLVADSAEATGLKWAAGGSSGMTLIKRASFSNVANTGTTFDNIFTSSYTSYLLVIDSIYSAAQNDDLHMQLRYAGPTTQTAAYYVSNSYVHQGTASTGYANSSNTAQVLLQENSGNSTYYSNGQMYFYNVGNSSQNPIFMGQSVNFIENRNYQFGGGNDTARTYTGVLFKTSSANITGTISVYGLAIA